MKYLDDFLREVRAADPAALMMSRRYCHARAVDSIVLKKRRDGRLERAFIVWPDHNLWKNNLLDTLTVGIHNHLYDIRLELICGHVRNICCSNSRTNRGTWMREYAFRSGVESGVCEVEATGWTLIAIDYDEGLGVEEMQAGDLHTVWCEKGKPAAWYVTEGDRTGESCTRLLTNSHVSTGGLYQQFDCSQAVIDHVDAWASTVLR